MAAAPIVFALGNPDPEIDPAVAAKHAEVVAVGIWTHVLRESLAERSQRIVTLWRTPTVEGPNPH